MAKTGKAKLTRVEVALPFGIGKAEWTPDETEKRAAWSLYVELVTRIAVQHLPEGGGIAREALSSLYSIFPTTREILKSAGPAVGARIPSLGGIAMRVLNKGLRPFLTKWHPRLSAWEIARPSTISAGDHEKEWPEKDKFEAEFDNLRTNLERYAMALGRIAGIEG